MAESAIIHSQPNVTFYYLFSRLPEALFTTDLEEGSGAAPSPVELCTEKRASQKLLYEGCCTVL
jgi:hypothetical protein